MTKILLSGLAIGKSLGACDVCNFDFDWIFQNPSAFLWLDKLVVPEDIWKTIIDKHSATDNHKINESLKLLFEMLDNEKLIEIINPAEYINDSLCEEMYKQVEKDREVLSNMFPEAIKIGDTKSCPGEIFINDIHYCSSYVMQIYISLYLAKILNAQIMYTEETLNYCKYKFGASNSQIPNEASKTKILTNVFNTILPVQNIFADYTFKSPKYCTTCSKEEKCESMYLTKTEKNINKLFELRYTDELYKVRDVLTGIINKQAQNNGILTNNDSKEILLTYKKESNKIEKLMKKNFTKIEKWTNLITLISLPIFIGGLVTGNPLVSNISGLTSVGSSSVKATIDMLKDKFSWVGFINKDKL